jgi:hypothetical protein
MPNIMFDFQVSLLTIARPSVPLCNGVNLLVLVTDSPYGCQFKLIDGFFCISPRTFRLKDILLKCVS